MRARIMMRIKGKAYVTTREAAAILSRKLGRSYSRSGVTWLVRERRVAARSISGRTWVDRASLMEYQPERSWTAPLHGGRLTVAAAKREIDKRLHRSIAAATLVGLIEAGEIRALRRDDARGWSISPRSLEVWIEREKAIQKAAARKERRRALAA